MATCSKETNAQNFYRLVSLLIDTGSEVLRKLFMKYVLQQTTSLDQFLLTNQAELRKLQNGNILHQLQMDLLFPSSGTSDIGAFDITLLSCLLKNICGKLPSQERKKIDNLRQLRNEVCGHVPRAEIQVNDFNVLWTKISQIINTLAQCSGDKKFVQEIQAEVNTLWINPRLKTSDILLQWYKSDQELQQQIEKQINEFTAELKKTKAETKVLQKYQTTNTAEIQRVKDITIEQHAEFISGIQSVITSTTKQHTEVKSEIQSVKESTVQQHIEVTSEIQSVKDATAKQHTEVMSEIESVKDSTAQRHIEVTSEIQSVKDKTAQQHAEVTSEIGNVKDKTTQKHASLTSEIQSVRDKTTKQHAEVTSKIRGVKDKTAQQHAEVTSEIQGVKDSTAKQRAEVTSEIESVKDSTAQQLAEVTSEIESVKDSTAQQLAEVTSEIESVKDTAGKQHAEIIGIGKTAKELETKLEQCLKQTDPALDKLLAISKRYILEESKQPYAETHLMAQVETKLSEGSCVILGKPGEGKTTTAANIMKRNFILERCLVLSYPHEWATVDIKAVDVVFIDDIFGRYQLDEGRLNEWLYVLDKMSACTGTGEEQIKVIIATRASIFKSCSSKVSALKLFSNVVELASDQLREDEKQIILNMCLKYNNKSLSPSEVSNCVKQFTSPIGFPFCCHLFTTNKDLFELREKFFMNPFKFFKDNLCAVAASHFAALVFLFLRGGQVPVCQVKDNNEMFCSELSKIGYAIGMPQVPTPSQIKLHLDDMNGVYVTRTDSCYVFVHNTVSEAVGKVYGESNPKYILRSCSADYLHQCITVDDCVSYNGNVKDGDKLVIQEQNYGELSERLISEITDKHEVFRTAAHPALRNENFLQVFLQKIALKKRTKMVFKLAGCLSKEFLPSYLSCICSNADKNGCKLLLEILKFLEKCNHLLPFSHWTCWKCKLMRECMKVHSINSEYGLNLMKLLLDHGTIPDSKVLNCTVLGGTTSGGNVHIVRAVMKHGAVPDAETAFWAVCGGNADIVRAVLKGETVPHKETISHAVKEGNVDIVRAVLEAGAMPDTETINCAVLQGNVDIVRAVLEAGAVPDKVTVECAVQGGNVDIARAAMTHGAVPDTETVYSAIRGGNVDIVRAVMTHGAVPDTETVYSAVRGGNADIVRAVLKGRTVPHKETLNHAVKEGNVDIVRAVLEAGAEPDKVTVNCAVQTGNVAIVRVVLEAGAVPDTETVNCAILKGNVDIVTTVMEAGAVPDTISLDCAVQGGNVDIVRAVKKHGTVQDKETVYWALQGGKVDIIRAVLEG